MGRLCAVLAKVQQSRVRAQIKAAAKWEPQQIIMKGASASQWEGRGFARRRRELFLILFTLGAAGCQPLQLERALRDDPHTTARASAAARQQRELAMNNEWHDRRYSDLVAALGKPRLVLNIPGGGNPPGFIVVYGSDPHSGCIDAFALMDGGDPTIRIYHCR